MKKSARLTLVALLAGSLSLPAYGTSRQCRLNYFAFDAAHQSCLVRTPEVRSIRRILQKVSEAKCSKCREAFPDEKKYSGLIERPYLALRMEHNDFGGNTVSVIFKDDPRIFRLWLYPIELDEYQIRAMLPEQLSEQATMQMLKYAKEQKYAKYWL